MVAGGLAIAVVSMADTSVLSRTFAGRSGLRVDQDQELLALGAANIGSGLFSGFSISASASRTPVAQQAGSKTQLTGVVGALAIVVLLLFVARPDHEPAAVRPGRDRDDGVPARSWTSRGLVRLWRLRRSEFVLSMVAFLGVAAVGVVLGIFLAVGARAGRLRLASVAAVLGDPGPRRRDEGVPRRVALPGGAPDRRSRPLPLGRAALLRERRARSASRSRRPSRRPRRRRAGSWSRPSPSPTST